MRTAIIHIEHLTNEDHPVWLATSNDIHGIIAEGDTLDELIETLNWMIPAMISDNHPGQSFNCLYEIAEQPQAVA